MDSDLESTPLLLGQKPRRQMLWQGLVWFWRFIIFGIIGSSSVAIVRFFMHRALKMHEGEMPAAARSFPIPLTKR